MNLQKSVIAGLTYLYLVLFFVFFSGDAAGTQLLQSGAMNKKALMPRYFISVGVNGLVTALAFKTDEDGVVSDLRDGLMVMAFFASSTTAVVSFQNFHSITPWLKTVAFTGGYYAITTGLLSLQDSYTGLLVSWVNWLFIMPYIASKVNYNIHLAKTKEAQLNLNLLKPAFLNYNDRIIFGMKVVELSW